MRDVADKSEPVAGADHLGPVRGEPLMRDDAGLEVADVVGRVVNELNVPDATLMRLLEPLEFSLQEIEPFYVSYDGGLPRCMCGLEIGCRKRATQAMVGDHLIHPIEAPKMVLVELARLRSAQRDENPGRIPEIGRAHV